MDVQRVRWSQLGSAGPGQGPVMNSNKRGKETSCSIYWLAQLINSSVPGTDLRARCIKGPRMRKASYASLQVRCSTSKTPGDFQVKFGKKGLHQRVQASELTMKNV